MEKTMLDIYATISRVSTIFKADVRRFFNDYIQHMSQLFISVSEIESLYDVFVMMSRKDGHPYKSSKTTFKNDILPMFKEPGSGWCFYQKEGGKAGQIDKDKLISKHCLPLADVAGPYVEEKPDNSGINPRFSALAPTKRNKYDLAKTDPIYKLFIDIGYNTYAARELNSNVEDAYKYIYQNDGRKKGQFFFRDEANTRRICLDLAGAMVGAELLDADSVLTDNELIYMLQHGYRFEKDRRRESSEFIEDVGLLSKVPGDIKIKQDTEPMVNGYSDKEALIKKLVKIIDSTKGVNSDK